MINVDDLYIVNYCHPDCAPLQNIMRLPQKEAFELAREMAARNTEVTAFYRFADFENYYPRRMETDQLLYDAFIALGGSPRSRHPLSFVLQGSEYLSKWFDNGIVTKIQLSTIPAGVISFTYGDSMAVRERKGGFTLITKEMLLDSVCSFEGTLEEYMAQIVLQHHYIEAQLWSDGDEGGLLC